MKTLIYTLMFAILNLWHISVNSQSFVKVTNSSLASPMEAIGTSWGDFDNDGDLDVYINAWAAGTNNLTGFGRLFINNCNGGFTQVSAMPGDILKDKGTWGCGASWIDIDNDGDLDMYIAHNDTRNNSLYINNGDGTFTTETQLNIVNDGAYTRGHVWADFNNDGHLDLFLSNDGGGGIRQNDMLFFSNGNGGYLPVTNGDIVNDHVRSENADAADYDNDGDMDLIVAAFGNTKNLLYKNNSDGTFTLVNDAPISSDYSNAWSLSWADIDNDLDLDLFIHNSFGIQNRLYINNGNGTFIKTLNDPLIQNYTHNNGGETWGDYDNDGDIDVFVSDFYKNQLYSNNGDGTFIQVTTEIVGNDNVAEAYGATWSDFDKDGDLDLLVPNAFGNPPNYFYINTYQNNGNNNHWLNIKCTGTQSNTSAIGARIYVKATISGQSKWQMREINANLSAAQGGQNPYNQHFGLSDATIIDSLKIYWPKSNITQIFTNVTPDRYIEITEGDNNIYAGKECNSDLPPKNPGIVKGFVYNDTDNDCEYNPTLDYYLPNRLIKASVGDYYVITNDNGEYELRLPEGNFDLNQIQLSNETLTVSDCPTTDPTYNVTVTENQTLQGYNFVSVLAGLECGVTMTNITTGQNPCPGQTTQLTFSLINDGAAIINLSTSITATPNLITQITSTCGNNLPANGGSCIVTVDITVPDDISYLGTLINILFTYTGTCQGNTISDSSSFNVLANCAFDPNDKALLSPEGCGENNIIAKNENLIYRLRFQNIGNAPAKDILVSDKLDANLDITSFNILDVSHNLSHFEVIPDNNLIFRFDSIMLPDSASNPVGSNGYIVFAIKAKSGLPDGTIIRNQAGIYFDFNEVVMTNSTSNMLMTEPMPVADFSYNHSCSVEGLVYDFVYAGNYTGIETFYWNFGSEAIPQTSTEMNPTNIVFTSSGVKNISLTVDRDGCNTSITKNITIEGTACGKDKVLICHNGKTICISRNALPAHLAHGDCIGKCPDNNKSASIIEKENINISYNNQNNTVEINSIEEKNKAIFEIYDYSGKLILSQSLGYLQQGTTIINTKNLSQGIYLGVIKTESENKIIKIIKY